MSSEKGFLSQHTDTVFQKQARLFLLLAAKFGIVRVIQVVLALRAWRGYGEKLRVDTVRQG